MDQKRLRRKLEQQTAHDNTAMRHWKLRREQRYNRLMETPVLPLFCKLCYIFLLVATAAGIFHDIYVYYAFSAYDAAKMLHNVTDTAFYIWLLFAAMLIPGAAVQLHRGFGDAYFERFRAPKDGKQREPLEARFRRYIYVSAAGLVLFFVLYLIF